MLYINKKFINYFAYIQAIKQVSKRTDLKSWRFAFTSLKKDSTFNLTLKDGYNMSYIQNCFFGKMST